MRCLKITNRPVEFGDWLLRFYLQVLGQLQVRLFSFNHLFYFFTFKKIIFSNPPLFLFHPFVHEGYAIQCCV